MPEGFDRRYRFDSPAAAVDAMVRALRADARPRDALPVRLADAHGLVLAERAVMDRDSPPFDQSSMDGYAVRIDDLRSGGPRLDVAGECRIGAPPPPMPEHRAAIRIATGAPTPIAAAGGTGADAVLKREEITEVESNSVVTSITVPPEIAAKTTPGQFIRRRGENARAGDPVLEAGTILSSAAVGALATIGHTTPRVHRRLRVGIITTGDEVVNVDTTPELHQIRNGNAAALAASLGACRWIAVVEPVHVADDPAGVLAALRQQSRECDAIILSGGVSMGHRDPVRAAVESIGAAIVFHGLPQRPGKPMLGALLSAPANAPAPIPIFGLPGNPGSALVTSTRIVLPVLGALAGIARWSEPPVVRVADPDGQSIDLWWHRPVRMAEPGVVQLASVRSSGDSVGIGATDGFVEVPPRVALSDSSLVAFHPWPGR